MPQKRLFNLTELLKDLKLDSSSKLCSGKLLLKFGSAKNNFVAKLQNLCSFSKNFAGFVRNPDNFIEVLYKTGKVLQFCYKTIFLHFRTLKGVFHNRVLMMSPTSDPLKFLSS